MTRVPLIPLGAMPPKLDPSMVGFTDLPGEIRNEIYRFASLAKHNPRAVHCKPCIPFCIPLGLLLSCRQVYEETKDIWYEENNFVEVVTNCQDLPEQITALGLPYIASHDGLTLRGGVRLMEKMMNPDVIVGLRFGCIAREVRTRYWFAGVDLEDFCAALWLLDRGRSHNPSAGFKCLDLRIELPKKSHLSRSQQLNLLEPFRQLGRLHRAYVSGTVDIDIALGLSHFLVNNQFSSPEAVIERVLALRNEAGRQQSLDNHFGSVVRFEQALAVTNYLSRWSSNTLSRRLIASAAPYVGKPIYYAKYVEISKIYQDLAFAYHALGLPERVEKAARESVSENQRNVLKTIGASKEIVAYGHYLLAVVLLRKGLRTGLMGCFKNVSAELRSCLSVRPENVAMLAHIQKINLGMYQSALRTTEQHKIWWEEQNGRPYNEYLGACIPSSIGRQEQ